MPATRLQKFAIVCFLAALVLFLTTIIAHKVFPQHQLPSGRRLGGALALLLGLGFAAQTLESGRKGFLAAGRGRRAFTRADLPRTFDASVGFAAAIGIIVALFGILFMIAG